MKLIGDHLGNLALDSKNVREVAVIGLTPQVRVVAGIDQLRIDSHMIRNALHAPFQNIGDTKFLGDLAKIARCRILVLHHACAANYLQITYLGEIGKDFVLDTVGKVGIGLFLAPIFEW